MKTVCPRLHVQVQIFLNKSVADFQPSQRVKPRDFITIPNEILFHHLLSIVMYLLIHALYLRSRVQNVLLKFGGILCIVFMNLGSIHLRQYFLASAHFSILLIEECHVGGIFGKSIVDQFIVGPSCFIFEELCKFIFNFPMIQIRRSSA